MSTGVIITLIICGTLIVLAVLNTIDKAIAAKKAAKTLNKFTDSWFKEDK